MQSEAFKKNWRRNWVQRIFELSNPIYQDRIWVNNLEPKIVSSFIEANCGYFDNLLLNDNYALALKEGLVTMHEFKSIENWHQNLSKYEAPDGDDSQDLKIVQDSNWKLIVIEGERAWKNLKSIVPIQEKELMEHLENGEYTF